MCFHWPLLSLCPQKKNSVCSWWMSLIKGFWGQWADFSWANCVCHRAQGVGLSPLLKINQGLWYQVRCLTPVKGEKTHTPMGACKAETNVIKENYRKKWESKSWKSKESERFSWEWEGFPREERVWTILVQSFIGPWNRTQAKIIAMRLIKSLDYSDIDAMHYTHLVQSGRHSCFVHVRST